MNFALTGAAIVIVSALGGIYFTSRHTEHRQTPVKMIFFGLYFWGLVFFQLLIIALVYALTRHGASLSF